MSALFNAAGGLRYHIRGWRHADREWAPFRNALGQWLADWQPGGPKLIVVGASAGYCLRPEWLAGFGEVVCVDPDPLARILFSRRLRAVSVTTKVVWNSDNMLSESIPSQQLRRFELILARHPGAPVLFSNFLGQLTLLFHENRVNVPGSLAAWKSNLIRKTMARRSWASFHDRVSGALQPQFEQPLHVPQRLNDDELIERLYAEPKKESVLCDHDTAGLFPADQPHSYFQWNLTPKQVHLIEATHSR